MRVLNLPYTWVRNCRAAALKLQKPALDGPTEASR